MPYEEHPECETPPDDAVLWRYMDLVKFLDILDGKRLWLPRLDLLEDPREGRLTDLEYIELAGREDRLANNLEGFRNTGYVSCWQENTTESMAMWDLYGGRLGSIAIRTTLKAIKTTLESYEHPAFIGKVKYYNWTSETQRTHNIIGMSVRKADSYRHENEVRIFVWGPLIEVKNEPAAEKREVVAVNLPAVVESIASALSSLKPGVECSKPDLAMMFVQAWMKQLRRQADAALPLGISIPVAPESLFSEVVVGPRDPLWVLELVRSVVAKYGAKPHVRRSELVFSRA